MTLVDADLATLWLSAPLNAGESNVKNLRLVPTMPATVSTTLLCPPAIAALLFCPHVTIEYVVHEVVAHDTTVSSSRLAVVVKSVDAKLIPKMVTVAPPEVGPLKSFGPRVDIAGASNEKPVSLVPTTALTVTACRPGELKSSDARTLAVMQLR